MYGILEKIKSPKKVRYYYEIKLMRLTVRKTGQRLLVQLVRNKKNK